MNKNLISSPESFRIWMVIVLFCLTFPVFPQDFNFRNYDKVNGLSDPFVYSVCQDSSGYLWIGSGNGLAKFNGLSFTNYSRKDSLSANFITSSFRDGKVLWFGHPDGKASFFDGKVFKSVIFNEKPRGRITSIGRDPDGNIWMSSFSDGLFKISRKEVATIENILPEIKYINCFLFINKTDILIGSGSGLWICKIDNDGVKITSELLKGIPEVNITAIINEKNGGYYVSTENEGIFHLSFEGHIRIVKRITVTPTVGFTAVQTIYEDSRSNLWAATFGSGLVRLEPSADGSYRSFCYDSKNGLPSDNIKTIFEDREGNIWIGSFGRGLTQITQKPFSLFTFDRSLYGNEIFSICPGNECLWVGTGKGLIKVDPADGRIIRFYNDGIIMPRDTVHSIYYAGDNDLWIGTHHNGVFRMNTSTGVVSNLLQGNGFPENSVNSISGCGNMVWIGTKKGLNYINRSTGATKSYSINQGGLPHNYINSLFVDRNRDLWVTGRSNTLVFISEEKVNKIPLTGGDALITLGPVTEDEDSVMWVGSFGNGLFIYKPDTVINITTNEGLLSDYCYSIVYNKGFVWVGHKTGLSRINVKDFSVRTIINITNNSERFLFNQNSSCLNSDNKIWFGTNRGLLCYDHSKELQVPRPPVLEINSVIINDVRFEYNGSKITLPSGNFKVRVNFIGISLKHPQLVTYKFMLKGYDEAWSDATSNRFALYPRLPEGNYDFLLKATSGEGISTSVPVRLTIIINKPLWKKWWFIPGLSGLWVIIIFMFIKLRERKLQKEKKMLEEKVIERTREINYQKDEIIKQHNEIELKNSNILSSIIYARNIQKAVLPSRETFNQLLPESFIMSKPKDIVSGDFYWLAEKDGKIIISVADCTGHGVPGAFMSLLGITLMNEIVNVHGITRSDLIVSELRRRLIDSLRQNRKSDITFDGMDIALCVIDTINHKLQFTGGMNDLVYIHNAKIEIIKADHLDVSASFAESGNFKMTEINYSDGDMIYLFTDGYQDQFGGQYNKKFLRPHFYTTLFEIHKLPVLNQKETLEKKLEVWMKSHIQTDDITVLGIRLGKKRV